MSYPHPKCQKYEKFTWGLNYRINQDPKTIIVIIWLLDCPRHDAYRTGTDYNTVHYIKNSVSLWVIKLRPGFKTHEVSKDICFFLVLDQLQSKTVKNEQYCLSLIPNRVQNFITLRTFRPSALCKYLDAHTSKCHKISLQFCVFPNVSCNEMRRGDSMVNVLSWDFYKLLHALPVNHQWRQFSLGRGWSKNIPFFFFCLEGGNI